MYAYQKKRLVKIFSVVVVIAIIGILIITPNISQIANSFNQVMPAVQNNIQSITNQQVEQSPYGPKETQYYIQAFRSSSLYSNLLDCSDSQLVHLLILYHNMYPSDKLTLTGNQYGQYLEDFNLGIKQSADLQNLFETYHC